MTRRIFDSHKPVIAAINGPAVGVGLTMTLAMDVRMAAAATKMGFVFAARGITPEAVLGVVSAAHRRDLDRARVGLLRPRLPLRGRARRGLLRSVHAQEELLPAARTLAREFADNTSAVSKAFIRHMFWRMLGAEHPIRAHEIDTAAIAHTGKSNDAREGIRAFLEKRPAQFTDRVSQDMPDSFRGGSNPSSSRCLDALRAVAVAVAVAVPWPWPWPWPWP